MALLGYTMMCEQAGPNSWSWAASELLSALRSS
jgi:hypothetical protein